MIRSKWICIVCLIMSLGLSSCGDGGGSTAERDHSPPVWGGFLGPQFTNISQSVGPQVAQATVASKVFDYEIRSNVVVDRAGYNYVIVQPSSEQLMVYKLDSSLSTTVGHTFFNVESLAPPTINFTIDRNNTLYIPHGTKVYVIDESDFVTGTGISATLNLELETGVAPVLDSSGYVIFSHQAVDSKTLSIYPLWDATQTAYTPVYQNDDTDDIETSTVSPVIYQDRLFLHGTGRVRVYNIQNIESNVVFESETNVTGSDSAKRMLVYAPSGDVLVEYVNGSGDAVALKSFDARTAAFNWQFIYDDSDPNIDLKRFMGVDANGFISFLDRPIGLVKMAVYRISSSGDGLDLVNRINLCGFTVDLSDGVSRCQNTSFQADVRLMHGFDSSGTTYLAFFDTDTVRFDHKTVSVASNSLVDGVTTTEELDFGQDTPASSSHSAIVGGSRIISGLPDGYYPKINVAGNSFLMLDGGLVFSIDKTLYLYR